MTIAKPDENGRKVLLGTSSADGTSLILPAAHPTRHTLQLNEGSTGTDYGNNASLDEDGTNVIYALSSNGDGTLVQVYVDGSGNLLVDSN